MPSVTQKSVVAVAVTSVAALALAAASCHPSADNPGTHDQTSWTSETAWRLSPDPVVDFAEFAGSPFHEFTRIRSSFFLDDGRIVAANYFNPPEIRAFHPNGELDWVAGGEGEGPGEFTLITRLFRGGPEILIASDSRQNRSTILGETGETLGVVRVELESGQERPTQRVILDRFSDGTYLGFPNLYFPGGERDYGIASVLMLRLNLNGSIVDTVGLFPWTDFQPGDGGVRTQPLFGASAVAITDGARILHGLGEDFSVRVYDLNGAMVGSFDRSHEPRTVTSEMLSLLEEEELAQVRGPESELWRAQIARRYRAGPRAEHLPAYERMLVDAEGHLWVQAFLAPVDTAITWSVFSPSGPFLGEVDVPPSFRIDDVDANYVLGVWTDELDVETLRTYRLIRPK